MRAGNSAVSAWQGTPELNNIVQTQRISRNDPQPTLIDFHPPRADMLNDVLVGFSKDQKELSPKYLYDERGSHLFEDITHLPEYYLTRTEDAIMEANLHEISYLVGPRATVVEFGSGSGEKIRRLLKHLDTPVGCVPVEISRAHLLNSARDLAADYPQLEVVAVCADFTRPFEFPPIAGARRRLENVPGPYLLQSLRIPYRPSGGCSVPFFEPLNDDVESGATSCAGYNAGIIMSTDTT